MVLLTNFRSPRCVDLSLGGAGSQTVSWSGWTQLGIPAVFQNIVAIHALDREELRAAQDVDHVVPEHSGGIATFLKGTADICPGGLLCEEPKCHFTAVLYLRNHNESLRNCKTKR